MAAPTVSIHLSSISENHLPFVAGSLQQAGFLFYVSDSEVTVPVNRTTFNSVRPVLELVFASLKDMLVKMTIPPQAICRVPCPAVNYVASKYNLEATANQRRLDIDITLRGHMDIYPVAQVLLQQICGHLAGRAMMKTELVPRRNSFKVVIEVSAGEKAALKRAMEAGILANHGFANGCMEIESCETNVEYAFDELRIISEVFREYGILQSPMKMDYPCDLLCPHSHQKPGDGERAQIYNKHIHDCHADDLHIYTDAAGQRKELKSCVATSVSMGNKAVILKATALIVHAELYGIFLALEMIKESSFNRFTVFTDSYFGINEIKNHLLYKDDLAQSIVHKVEELNAQGKKVCICFVPAHVGICGNERADRFATLALSLDQNG